MQVKDDFSDSLLRMYMEYGCRYTDTFIRFRGKIYCFSQRYFLGYDDSKLLIMI